MTLIEFFEKNATENVCSIMTKGAERVIFVGDDVKRMKKHAERYKVVLAERGVQVEFDFCQVGSNNIQYIVQKLVSIVEAYDDCVFDLTGGKELHLLAAGIICERYKDRAIQMHRFNITNNTVLDVDQDGKTILERNAPEISVEENVRIYGGNVIHNEIKKGATLSWDMNDDFKKDIRALWDICRRDVRKWNKQVNMLALAEKLGEKGDDTLSVRISVAHLKKAVERYRFEYVEVNRIVSMLCDAGLLKACYYDKEQLALTYKNEQVKRCLTVSGLVLEMRVFLAALEAKGDNGVKIYNDALQGVFIDWDGDIHLKGEEADTKNEIDVMMMHGMVPVFVSCKNGDIKVEELYKLLAVANQFGGKYAKKVIIATSLDKSRESDYIRQRASDMGIRLVEGRRCNKNRIPFTELDDKDINSVISSLWSN